MHQAWQGLSLSQRSSVHRRAGGPRDTRHYSLKSVAA